MTLHDKVAYSAAKSLTNSYSTSFSLSSRLFDKQIVHHIYAIYSIVRVADEIVDSYGSEHSASQLSQLEVDIKRAKDTGFSTNPYVHAFAKTALQYNIGDNLTRPFFDSMGADIKQKSYNRSSYENYIYGSAEVVGLMCLRVFCGSNTELYDELAPGARKLGAAYQKINFLRDIRSDYEDLGRLYFPGIKYDNFDEDDKQRIAKDIESDLLIAREAISKLPLNSRKAVLASYNYYARLYEKLKSTPVNKIKSDRIRVNNLDKLWLTTKVILLGNT